MRSGIRKICFFIMLFIMIFFLTGCSNQEFKNQDNNSNAEKMRTDIVNDNNKVQKNVTEIKKNATGSSELTISEFSTKIYNKEEARQNNLRITCNKLNGSIVKKGSTFSFEEIVGKATKEERISRIRHF